MKRKNKKVIFLSSLLGCSTLIASGLIVSSCSTKVNTQNLNKTNPIIANPTTSLSENQNISDGINLNPSITKNDSTENKDTNSESSTTSTEDDSDKLSTTQDDNKNNSTLPLSSNNSNILSTIENHNAPLDHKIGWYNRVGNTFTINLKSANEKHDLFKDENKKSIPINLRLFEINIPYKLKLKASKENPQKETILNSNGLNSSIITTSQGNYYAEYEYENLELDYVYNSNLLASELAADSYFDGANYGHYLYSKYGFRFNKNYNNNDSEITFDINLQPVHTPTAKNENNKQVTQPYEFTQYTTFYTSGYIFIMKWWTGQLSAKDKDAKDLEAKLKEALKKYLSSLFKNNKNNGTSSNTGSNILASFFIKHNDGDATNDPINHWNCNWDGKYYGQWIADSIYRDELKKTK